MNLSKGILYVSIVVFSAIYVINHQNYSKRIGIIDGYTQNFSVERGDTLKFYLNPEIEHRKGVVCIFDIHGKIVDSLVLNLKKQLINVDSLKYQNGYNYTNEFRYCTKKLESGIYLLGNVVSFIVKDNHKKNSITVVFPYCNYMAINSNGGRSFDPENSKNKKAAKWLSMSRPFSTSNNPVLFLHWMDSIYGNENLNYITDLDLINFKNIENTRLMVIYGYSSFWTLEQRKNFDKFQEKGGNVLAICSYLMNNKFLYDSKKMQMYFYGNGDTINSFESRTGVWRDPFYNYPNINSVGCSYEIVDKPKEIEVPEKELIIINFETPIFNKIGFYKIKLVSDLTNSIKFKWENNVPVADNSSGNFFYKKILAYELSTYNNHQTMGGIYYMRKTKYSGKLIVFGNGNWCDDRNFANRNLRTITENTINYLSKQ